MFAARRLSSTLLLAAFLHLAPAFESFAAPTPKPLALCALPDYAKAPAPPENAPNFLFIAVDTLRADHLGLYGHARKTSPWLDQLAGDSLVFERAIAAAPWTTPSFAAVFTGRHPAALGMDAEPAAIPTPIKTLTEELSDRGYASAGVVSHFFVGEKFGFHRGFGHWDQRYARGHRYVSSQAVQRFSQACLNELGATERPFFLFTHFFDPHYDYVGHDEFPFHQGYEGPLKSRRDNFETLRRMAKAAKLSDADRDQLINLYDSEIGYTDLWIGRMIGYLKKLGLYDNTAIFFFSDHGEMFGERNNRWIGHTQYLFDELVRVPLMIKLPKDASGRWGSKARGRVSRTVSLVDLMPTVLAMADSRDDPRSLLSEPQRAAPVFSQTRRWRKLDAIYEHPWKLVVDRGNGRHLLYDLGRDPGEQRNLATQQQERVQAMQDRLDQWLRAMAWSAAEFQDVEPPTLSEEELRMMRSLGYIQ